MAEHEHSRQERLKEELYQDVQLEEPAIRQFEQGPPGLKHPPGLFLLFIVEMWERFSYYGMRGLLMLYMVAEVSGTGIGGVGGGLGLARDEAGKIYGWYTALVYLTPIFGGMLADKLIGTHRSMVVGGIIITLGHAALATIDLFHVEGSVSIMQNVAFYSGLALIIIGTGFFKPCVSVMVGQLYEEGDPRRDAGFTIYYMGINVGAFLAGIICAWLAATFGWWAGFGAAGVGMFFGIIAYLLGRPKFLSGVGLPPAEHEPAMIVIGKLLGVIAIVAAVVGGYVVTNNLGYGAYYLIAGIVAAVAAVIWFVSIQQKHERGPTAALFIIALFVIFFWYAFEQAGSSLNVFAQQRTDRAYPWAMGDDDGVILSRDLGEKWQGMDATTFGLLQPEIQDGGGGHGAADADSEAEDAASPFESNPFNVGAGIINITQRNGNEFTIEVEPETTVAEFAAMLDQASNGTIDLEPNEANNGVVLTDTTEGAPLFITDERGSAARDLRVLSATEFPAAWYQSVNSLFIIIFAPVFGFLWGWLRRRRLEPATAFKMSYGLILLGLGFVFMVMAAKISDGGNYIAPNADETPDGMARLIRTGAFWLVLTYLLHTWGELCLSPIGLSLTTKLAPRKWVSFMMGVWFLAPSIAQLIGGYTFAYIEPIEKGEAFDPIVGGQGDFFLVFVITSVGAGVVMLAISPLLKKLMAGKG
ncbi:MAG: oligopeptide:H+ symporter [Planctomycetota bacterium]|nr:oligopeptide:H+ symporter [Planctomycetota bacterium]